MRNILLALAWSFVLSVAAYDAYFAWQYRVVFQTWELNPLARWLAHGYGLSAVFAMKMALLGFALSVAAYCHRRRHRLEVPYTLVICAAHLWLSVHYLLGQLQSV